MTGATKILLSPTLWRAVLWVYWTAMFIGTHIPSSLPNLSGGVLDKFVHLGAFAGLAFLFCLNWQLWGGHITWRHYAIAAIVLAGYGALDEYLQQFVHRDCSLADWASDLAGIALGIAVFHYGRDWVRR